MITYNWNCRTVDVHPQEDGEENVVYNVHWILTGVSEELDINEKPYSSTSIGTQLVKVDPEKEFIPFDELTNDVVVEWTKEAMGEDEVSAIEQSVSNQVSELENPTSVTLTIEK
jgi:hypothetical protein